MAVMQDCALQHSTGHIILGARKEITMNLIQKLRSALGEDRASRMELDYLNEAVSIVDLESRQRQIDRGRFRKRSFSL
jgi:hypothetical protein